jgi:hypothetical protein
VIVAVPQTIIAAGFRLNRIEFPDGSRVEWAVRPELDLCRESAFQSTKHLLKFLNDAGTQNQMMDRVVLCTHATLVRAFEKNRASFKDVLIVIDEAHHIMHGGDEEFRRPREPVGWL